MDVYIVLTALIYIIFSLNVPIIRSLLKPNPTDNCWFRTNESTRTQILYLLLLCYYYTDKDKGKQEGIYI